MNKAAIIHPLTPPKGATGVFRVATECGYGPTKGSESPFATEGRGGLGRGVFFLLFLLSFVSCNNGEVNSKFCNMPARLTIENVQQAPVLFTACESMGEYCYITSDGQRFLFTDAANHTSPIPITAIGSYSGYYLGLNGFIVGKLTIPELGEDFSRVVCYDRACANCYQNYNITKPLILLVGGYAKCNNCGRTYNLNDVGNVSDGPAGRPLYRYRVNYIGNALVINNG